MNRRAFVFVAMILRRILTSGFVLLGLSVVIIPYGVHLQLRSENFSAFEAAQINASYARHGGHDHGADVSFLQYTWPLVFGFTLFAGVIFTIGVWIIRVLAYSCHDLSLVASGCFGCGCLVGAMMAMGEAGLTVYWGFIILAAGYLTAAAGLILGAIGTVVNCLIFWDEHPTIGDSSIQGPTRGIRR